MVSSLTVCARRRPFNDYYPGTLGAAIRIKSSINRHGFDYNVSCNLFHQWEHINNNEYQKVCTLTPSSSLHQRLMRLVVRDRAREHARVLHPAPADGSLPDRGPVNRLRR